jgi:hypothetical protein
MEVKVSLSTLELRGDEGSSSGRGWGRRVKERWANHGRRDVRGPLL